MKMKMKMKKKKKKLEKIGDASQTSKTGSLANS